MSNYEETFDRRGHLYNEATVLCPAAREAERRVLLDLLDPQPGETICDVPAGGGYVADGLRARFGDRARVICIEPSAQFAAAINPAFEVRRDPLEALTLADQSVDAIASLAGLHHFEDKMPALREWHRVLRPGGRCVVADVEAGGEVAAFLNVFVDRATPGGHRGIFVRPGELTDSLRAAGFSAVDESLRLVPWKFADAKEMAVFCHRLFGLSKVSPKEVGAALEEYLTVETCSTGVRVPWRLRYAGAVK